ncbi:phage major capsid protein [Mycolicibacterium sp. 050158]|uniref:phage major capsid protein n=1 Tax=Mycolicibacterium sp. 050158 TaxID=3090602 RepID=UPI00299D345D|nr:phage major capsid protein [Mycolicibacterium sp. 050158]MDX1890117.1 phage major capsid protein [Mycolicibacterium sp. 050158]
MASTTTGFAPILTPAQVGGLVIQPLIAQSIAGNVLTPIPISTHSYRVPLVTADPAASWTAEGAEITATDATLDELDITPSKLAALSVISRELADDSTPQAAEAVGQGIVRDLVRKVDAALFAATTTNGPGGLAGLSGITTVSAGTSYANVDAFSDALYTSATHNGQITAWVTNPATAQTLAKVKQYTSGSSNVPLLGPDPTVPGQRQILGVPLLTSPGVPTTNNVVWGIPKDYAYFIIRQDAQVESDRSVFFTSDRVAIRATLRVGFGFPNPAAIVKIATS